MRTFVLGLMLFGLLAGGMVGGWLIMNRVAAGSVGTPAHAGSLTNGHPEDCTNVNFQVKARSVVVRSILLQENSILRGTYEVDGGFGKVDIILRINTPQSKELAHFNRAENFDFMFPVQISGEYQLVFDNRYSMFTPKAVGLFYCIDKGRRPGQ